MILCPVFPSFCLVVADDSHRMRVVSIEGCFDRRSFRSIKVVSIEDKSRFDRRQESFRSKIVTIAQSVFNLLFIKSV